MFSTVDEEIEFLEDGNFDQAHLDLLLLHGRKLEAASLHQTEGRFLEAADLFIEAANLERAQGCLLQGLWRLMSFGAMSSPDIQVDWSQINELLDRFEAVDQQSMAESDLQEVRNSGKYYNRDDFF